MFKTVNFTKDSTDTTPYDSDVEPKTSSPLVMTADVTAARGRLRETTDTGSPDGAHKGDDVQNTETTDPKGPTVMIQQPSDDKIAVKEGDQPEADAPITIKPGKHVTITGDSDLGNALKLPSFKKRPLSDTPVVSAWTSPSTSPSASPSASSINLSKLMMSAPKPDKVSNARDGKDTGTANNSTRSSSSGNGGDHIETDQTHMLDASSKGKSMPNMKRRPTTIDVPGLTKSKNSPDGTISNKDPGSKLIIVMVGLPATGKSFITNKLSRFLNYSMYYCKVFNVGNTRRTYAKEHGLSEQDSKFFDPNDVNSSRLRNKWALDTLDELLDYLLIGSGSVGIFDATNTTKERRKAILEKISKRNKDIKVLFLESICTNKHVVENNIKLKLFGPDYKGKDPEASLRDFKERLANYLKAYEPIEDDENIPYIKMIDVGRKVIAYRIQGFLASQTVYYLLNFNLTERQIWITRNGESVDNMYGRIGGNSHLTPRGLKYAKALTKFIGEQKVLFHKRQLNKKKSTDDIRSKDDIVQDIDEHGNDDSGHDFLVWTSMRTRSVETAQFFDEDEYPVKQMKMLDELNAGDYEGMTYMEIQSKFPAEFAKRQQDKLQYRYPGIAGESYMDVINRLRPVITELERIGDSALIVTHRVVARALLGYYMNLSVDIISNLDVPLHCVYCLETKPYGITWSLWEYDEATDSFSKVPETDLNTTTVQQIGLVHKERRLSVIPTAPSSVNMGTSDFLTRRRSSVSISTGGIYMDFKERAGIDRARAASTTPEYTPRRYATPGVSTGSGMLLASPNTGLTAGNSMMGETLNRLGTPSSRFTLRGSVPQKPTHNSVLLRRRSGEKNFSDTHSQVGSRPELMRASSDRYPFEIDKLNEKLTNLKDSLGDRYGGSESEDDRQDVHNSRLYSPRASHAIVNVQPSRRDEGVGDALLEVHNGGEAHS